MIEQHIGQIILGSSGLILSLIIGGIKAVHTRIRKLEDRVIILEKDLELNTELDKARARNE